MCQVVGVLDNGSQSLTEASRRVIKQADVVIAGTRLLALMADEFSSSVECLDLTGQLSNVPEWIVLAQTKEQKVIVLATGDPLCHGIASYLIKKLGQDNVGVLPNLSMLQLACSTFGLAWQQCQIGSVHSQDAGEWVIGADAQHGLYALLQLLRQSPLTIAYTSPDNTPDRLARMLQIEGLAKHYEVAVAECLLQEDERISRWMSIDEAASQSFASPNVILFRALPTKSEPTFGLADERFKQRKPDKGLITKREVRAVSLARMALKSDSIVWDIGAGSGSVGIEASRLCSQGHVYAIEKNTDDTAIALANKVSFKASNYSISQGRAPEGLDLWPNPDVVFIGGSGGELKQLILLCLQRLSQGGQLVMNFVTLENLNTAMSVLKECSVEWDVVQLQASRSKPILSMNRMQAENTVWIVCATATRD
jgi:precorrin-6Y C5,15-methyltransferase (decarboxylating)